MSGPISRRGLFSFLSRPLRGTAKTAGGHIKAAFASPPPPPPIEELPEGDTVAVVQGRHCMAYHSICSACYERCPIAGAFVVESGIPSVDPNYCTGCQICHQVCPAPTNAILLVPRRKFGGRPPAGPGGQP